MPRVAIVTGGTRGIGAAIAKALKAAGYKVAANYGGNGGIKDMAGLPEALFIVDVGYHKIAVAEAEKLGIPVVAVVDTNHSPAGITHIIPGNDDSSRAVRLYARGIADAILEGKAAGMQNIVAAVSGDEFVEVDEGVPQDA